MEPSSDHPLTIEQLAALREKTEGASKLLTQQLTAYLDTLKPIFAPRRILGRHVGASDDVNLSDRSLAQMKEQYQLAGHAPFRFASEFPAHLLTQVDNLPVVYPWEYSYTVHLGEKTDHHLTITSPVRWILMYDPGVTLSHVRAMAEGKIERHLDSMRQCVVNALVMTLYVKNFPGVVKLLEALRYTITTECLPGFGQVPFVTIHACVNSFRPSDDLLLTATRFSGVPAFIELIDATTLQEFHDPIKAKLQEIFA